MHSLAISISFALSVAAALSAQAFTSFSGAFVDPQGAVLPGVRATLINPARQAKYEIVSDRDGRFEFAGLVPGDYQFKAEVLGFQPYRGTLQLTGRSQSRQVTLEVGRLQETVTVVEPDGTEAPPVRGRQNAAPRPNPPCPPPPPNGVAPIGGNLRPPFKIRDVKPIYPAARVGAGLDAVVVLDTVIGLDGFVREAVARDGADPLFADALITAVRQWQFDSTLLNCHPVEVKMTVTGAFKHR